MTRMEGRWRLAKTRTRSLSCEQSCPRKVAGLLTRVWELSHRVWTELWRAWLWSANSETAQQTSRRLYQTRTLMGQPVKQKSKIKHNEQRRTKESYGNQKQSLGRQVGQQTSKHANKQTNKQTNKHTRTETRLKVWVLKRKIHFIITRPLSSTPPLRLIPNNLQNKINFYQVFFFAILRSKRQSRQKESA